ncbi:MAG TPA: alcohol dehydrogenase catalytic domain-containing protein, partial [Acidimicrobiales bacterium]|nr:alcohol dehydrogenase catalytic domain-containing protein [Acidimicrobiales bacterium]
MAREAATFIGGLVDKRSFVSRLAPVRLEDIAEPVPPGPGWVVCETIVSGLCGSDSKQILLNGRLDNPITALLSFPHVLGHEAVARRLDTGQRCVLNPWLSCVPRGLDPPCPACAEGRYPWCRNFSAGLIPPALHLGNCAGAAGAHAERFAAHESQLFPVPADMPDEVAVLADPVSVSLRTLLLNPPTPGKPALVYGSGTLAYAAIALLRHLFDVEVWAVTREGKRAEMAAAVGAHAVLPSEPDALVRAVARRLGVRSLVPWSGQEWLQD